MTANLLMLAAFAISIALALACVLCLRWWRQREERRSPLQRKQVGHVPGQQLVDRVADSQEEMLLSVMVMYFAFPMMLLAWALQRVPAERIRFDGGSWIFVLGALVLFGFGLHRFVRFWRARQSARDGLLAERFTRMLLNRLGAQGCTVMHDLRCEGFNIDHVVIAPRGVYAVETKSFRKPKGKGGRDDRSYRVGYDGAMLRFPDFATSAPIEQAVQQAQWLQRHLREVLHREFPVIPAVSLPGWFVDRDETAKRAEVVVFTPVGKGPEFMAWQPERIAEDQRHLIAQALALRYPEVE